MTLPIRIGRFVLAGFAMLAIVAIALPASAQSLDELRASGVVGERYDGLLVVRDIAAGAPVKTMVEETNAKRMDIYKKRAAAEGTTPDQVGRVYAKQIVKNAPRGTWFLGESGAWKQLK